MGEVVGRVSVGAGATGMPRGKPLLSFDFLAERQNLQTKFVFVE
jgi:hypothetical protein